MSKIKTRYFIGAPLNKLLKENNITVSELSKTLKVSRPLIYYYLNDVKSPTDKTLEKICDYFGCDMEYFTSYSTLYMNFDKSENRISKFPDSFFDELKQHNIILSEEEILNVLEKLGKLKTIKKDDFDGILQGILIGSMLSQPDYITRKNKLIIQIENFDFNSVFKNINFDYYLNFENIPRSLKLSSQRYSIIDYNLYKLLYNESENTLKLLYNSKASEIITSNPTNINIPDLNLNSNFRSDIIFYLNSSKNESENNFAISIVESILKYLKSIQELNIQDSINNLNKLKSLLNSLKK